MATLGDALYGGLLRQLLAWVCTVFCISIALVFARYFVLVRHEPSTVGTDQADT